MGFVGADEAVGEGTGLLSRNDVGLDSSERCLDLAHAIFGRFELEQEVQKSAETKIKVGGGGEEDHVDKGVDPSAKSCGA